MSRNQSRTIDRTRFRSPDHREKLETLPEEYQQMAMDIANRLVGIAHLSSLTEAERISTLEDAIRDAGAKFGEAQNSLGNALVSLVPIDLVNDNIEALASDLGDSAMGAASLQIKGMSNTIKGAAEWSPRIRDLTLAEAEEIAFVAVSKRYELKDAVPPRNTPAAWSAFVEIWQKVKAEVISWFSDKPADVILQGFKDAEAEREAIKEKTDILERARYRDGQVYDLLEDYELSSKGEDGERHRVGPYIATMIAGIDENNKYKSVPMIEFASDTELMAAIHEERRAYAPTFSELRQDHFGENFALSLAMTAVAADLTIGIGGRVVGRSTKLLGGGYKIAKLGAGAAGRLYNGKLTVAEAVADTAETPKTTTPKPAGNPDTNNPTVITEEGRRSTRTDTDNASSQAIAQEARDGAKTSRAAHEAAKATAAQDAAQALAAQRQAQAQAQQTVMGAVGDTMDRRTRPPLGGRLARGLHKTIDLGKKLPGGGVAAEVALTIGGILLVSTASGNSSVDQRTQASEENIGTIMLSFMDMAERSGNALSNVAGKPEFIGTWLKQAHKLAEAIEQHELAVSRMESIDSTNNIYALAENDLMSANLRLQRETLHFRNLISKEIAFYAAEAERNARQTNLPMNTNFADMATGTILQKISEYENAAIQAIDNAPPIKHSNTRQRRRASLSAGDGTDPTDHNGSQGNDTLLPPQNAAGTEAALNALAVGANIPADRIAFRDVTGVTGRPEHLARAGALPAHLGVKSEAATIAYP